MVSLYITMQNFSDLLSHGQRFRVGNRVDDYEITGLLGVGAMSEVWCARNLSDGSMAAIKILNSDGPENLQRFQREQQLLTKLSHPGIVRCYGTGTLNGRPWMALEVLDPLPESAPEKTVRSWLLQLCDATAELHRRGLIHRDIKRGNVMLRGTHAVLTDFGIVKAIAGTPAETESDGPLHLTRIGEPHALGTFGRSAPEQFEGSELSPAADVYALGMLVRDLLPDWKDYTLWRDIMPRVLVTDPVLRIPSARALASAIRSTRICSRLLRTSCWVLPLLAGGTLLGYGPLTSSLRLRGWKFLDSPITAMANDACRPKTVCSHIILNEPVTELLLADNPGGVIWTGLLEFRHNGPLQRLILHSNSPERKTVIGDIRALHCEPEIILVGNVVFHCTSIHGHIPFPTAEHPLHIGEPYSKLWIDHFHPVTHGSALHLRRVETIEEARQLPLPPKRIPYSP